MDDCRPGIEPTKITTLGAHASASVTKTENSAIITYRKFLEETDASVGNIGTRIREFISAFKDMSRNLRDSAPDVPKRVGDVEAAREALEAGKTEDARLLLATLGNDECESGVRTLPKDFLTKTFFLRAKTV